MPEIELRRAGLDSAWILALMNFPTDSAMRRSYYAVCYAAWVLEECRDEPDVIGVDLIEGLISAPSKSDLGAKVADETKKGVVAGNFLLTMYVMNAFPETFSEPSVRKAIYAARVYASKTRFGDGSSLPTSETAIRKYFDEFRSVAHLWAATRLHESLPIRDQREILGSAEAVRDFLGIARTLEDFGCVFVPKRAKPKQPILDRNSIWRVPESFPRLHPPWKGPPEWLVEAMENYCAK